MRRGSGNLGSLMYSIFFIYLEVNKKSPDKYFEPRCIKNMYKEGFGEPRFPDKGRLRESNPRPLVPKTRIIPLDQSDNSTYPLLEKVEQKTLLGKVLQNPY